MTLIVKRGELCNELDYDYFGSNDQKIIKEWLDI